jgi:hypothetical protein
VSVDTEKPKDEAVQGAPEGPAKFGIGFDSADPSVMIVQIPIREWAMDYEHGTALLHGHLREAEAVGMRTLSDLRKRLSSGGLLRPNGPIPPVVH